MPARLTASRIVGRAPELAELEGALSEASAGRPSLAFVAGESGVGKTRLLSELARRARRRGARVLSGDCVELGEGELPYAPIVAVLRGLARAGDPALDDLSPVARTELGRLLPGLGAEAPAVSDGRPEEDIAQARLFEALLSLLDRLGRDEPVLLALEDLHWADRSTRAFVAFLSRTLCAERVFLVATYRSDEMHRRHPLRPLLAELERDVRARRIELARLTRDELAEQLEDILGETPSPELVDRLLARSEGNPLFVEELLAAGDDGRGALPGSLRDALMVRVERLPEPAQEVLRLVSTGQRLGHELLADASGLAAAELREALREAVAGHILAVDDEGRYAFRHALLREVVHDDLLPGEHTELHRLLADALERQTGDSGAHRLAAIAHHRLASGDRPAALAASVRAAAAAEAVEAHGEASALLERSLELFERVPDPEQVAGVSHVALLAWTAHAHDMAGDHHRMVTLLRGALDEVDEAEDPILAGALHERLARGEWSLARGEEALAHLDRALELLPSDRPLAARAAALTARVRYFVLQSRYSEAVAAAPAALEAARAARDASAESRALNARGLALMTQGRVDEGAASLREAIAVARAARARHDESAAWLNLSDALNVHGRALEAREAAREGIAATQAGRPDVRWIGLNLAEIEFGLGNWAEVERLLPAPHIRRDGMTGVHLLLRRGELALGRGDLGSARTALDAASDRACGSLQPQFRGTIAGLRAELSRRTGDLEEARRIVDDALEGLQEDWYRIAMVAGTGATIEADAAQRARDLGDSAAERAAVAAAAGHVDRIRAVIGESQPVEAARLRTAEADLARARGADDPALWAAAVAAWDMLEQPYPAAQAQRRQAEAHVLRDDREAATDAARAALDTARRLGSVWLAEDVESFAARARLRLGVEAPEQVPAVGVADGAGRTSAQPADPADELGLTARERQVLVLLAAGRTNREIGETLFMAEKTASVHVSRILAKLDVRSRTEAAAVAHRLGLDAA